MAQSTDAQQLLEETVKMRIGANTVEKLSVAELKNFLALKGVTVQQGDKKA